MHIQGSIEPEVIFDATVLACEMRMVNILIPDTVRPKKGEKKKAKAQGPSFNTD